MSLTIEGKRRSLKVDINSRTGVFLFAGVSLPENTNAFFQPILVEMEKYLTNPLDMTVINFHIEYLNTSSALFLRRIVMLCEEKLKKNGFVVNWHYEEDDEDILEFGNDFNQILKNTDIQMVKVSSDSV